MNSSVSSSVSEFSRNRPATGPSNKRRLPTTLRNMVTRVRSWLGKLASFAYARVLMIFVIGFAAGAAWQSYGGAARKAIAGWSPHLAWLAPAAAPVGASPERLKATTIALAAVRQSVDKLSTEITKLQAQGGNSPRRRPTR
jgi:hypothetical protein